MVLKGLECLESRIGVQVPGFEVGRLPGAHCTPWEPTSSVLGGYEPLHHEAPGRISGEGPGLQLGLYILRPEGVERRDCARPLGHCKARIRGFWVLRAVALSCGTACFRALLLPAGGASSCEPGVNRTKQGLSLKTFNLEHLRA